MKDPTIVDLRSPARAANGWFYVVTLKSTGEEKILADSRAIDAVHASLAEARTRGDDCAFSGVLVEDALFGKGYVDARDVSLLAYDDENEEVDGEPPADRAQAPSPAAPRPTFFPKVS